MFKIKYVTKLNNHELYYEREFDDRTDDPMSALARMQSECDLMDHYLLQCNKRKLNVGTMQIKRAISSKK